MLGRFHEISIQTKDIRASVEFYERLGFSQAETGETWTHPYGVLTDGRIFLGLHQIPFDSPALSFVHAEVARYAAQLAAQGVKLVYQRTAEHVRARGGDGERGAVRTDREGGLVVVDEDSRARQRRG